MADATMTSIRENPEDDSMRDMRAHGASGAPPPVLGRLEGLQPRISVVVAGLSGPPRAMQA
jgi:hypothetical protein